MAVTFVGLVSEGGVSRIVVNSGWNVVGSVVPKAGGIQTTLGYNPVLGDTILLWKDNHFESVIADDFGSGPVWSDGNNPLAEPVVGVGEGFFIQPAETHSWLQTYSTWH